MNFDQAFDRLIGHEGGYVNHPADPGGETNWGISKASYPKLDIKNLTREQAKEIYLRDYWKAFGADQYDAAIGFQIFDAAVNHRPEDVAKMLQRAAGVTVDGQIGAKTIAAVRASDKNDMVIRFIAYRIKFWTDLNTWATFGRGWARRAADDLLYAAQDN